jgi:hypothetical protein
MKATLVMMRPSAAAQLQLLVAAALLCAAAAPAAAKTYNYAGAHGSGRGMARACGRRIVGDLFSHGWCDHGEAAVPLWSVHSVNNPGEVCVAVQP